MKKLILALVLVAFNQQAFAEEIQINSLADLEKCERMYSSDTGMCFEPFKKFIEANPKQTLDAAKKGRRVFASWAVLPFFEKALMENKDPGVCADSDFQVSLFSAMGQSPSSDVFLLAKKLLNGDCSAELINPIIKEMDDSTNSTFDEVVCPILKKFGKSHKNCEPKPEVAEIKTEPEKLPIIDKKKMKISGAKVYSGPEGARIIIGDVSESEDTYLIKFEGFKSSWNNKSVLHKGRKVKNDGSMDFWTENNGSQWTSITARNCYSGYCQYEVYMPEGPSSGMVFFYDGAATKKINVQELLKTY